MASSVWISVLEKDEALGKELFGTIAGYGITASGHFWTDDLEKMAWSGALAEVVKPEYGVWLVAGTKASFDAPSVRFGLSLTALGLQGKCGHGFHIMLVCVDCSLDPADLPTPLAGAELLDKNANLNAKLAARTNMPPKKVAADYRFDVIPMPGLGLWLECGPAKGHSWKGALCGVSGGVGEKPAEVNAHGVGPAGTVPESAILNYAMQGIKLTAGEREYVAWAVQNPLTDADSYFVRLLNSPEAVVFGELGDPDANEGPELYTLRLV